MAEIILKNIKKVYPSRDNNAENVVAVQDFNLEIADYDNLAFPLKLKKMDKDEIDKKVREAAEILDITQFLKRKPKALSGCQTASSDES